jgi:heat shock protein HslJ
MAWTICAMHRRIIMLRTKFILSFFLIALFAAANDAAQTLPQGKWRLASYNFKQKIAFPIDKMEITMNIHADGKLGGKSGCNVYGGSYAFENGKLKITDIISTMMACEEPSMQFEHLFNDTLLGTTEYSLKDSILTLTDPKTANFLRFELMDKKSGAKHRNENR